MEKLTWVALGSLAGFAASVVLYPRFPLPPNGTTWTLDNTWGPVAVLLIGLSCFVVLLPTGMIALLNWIDRRSDRKDVRR